MGADARYILEVLEPKADKTIVFRAESTSPFQAITVGDLINPRVLKEGRNARGYEEGLILRVTVVEHLFHGEDERVKHHLLVHTEWIDQEKAWGPKDHR